MADSSTNAPKLADVEKAYERIAMYIHRTPVLSSRLINEAADAELFFKCENFQKTGSFKFRGACNAVFSLGEQEARRGVATHSSGNFAGALALAAKTRGIDSWIVMPETAPAVKVEAVKAYGGKVRLCQASQEGREKALQGVVDKTGATYIASSDNYRVIEGQGTAAMELLEDVDDLDIVITPLGGGGLLSGSSIVVKSQDRPVRIFGSQSALADDGYRSFRSGKRVKPERYDSIADGLRVALSEKPFHIIRELADDVLVAGEQETVEAMKLIYERMKIVIEPSAAVPAAAILEKRDEFAGKRVGVIISGGNVDLGGYFDLLREKIPH